MTTYYGIQSLYDTNVFLAYGATKPGQLGSYDTTRWKEISYTTLPAAAHLAQPTTDITKFMKVFNALPQATHTANYDVKLAIAFALQNNDVSNACYVITNSSLSSAVQSQLVAMLV